MQNKNKEVTTPREGLDVTCGRGEKAKKNNAHYRKLIQQFFPAYANSVTRDLKPMIAQEIINIVKSRGGRFFDEKTGVVLTQKQAHSKVMKALKDYKRQDKETQDKEMRSTSDVSLKPSAKKTKSHTSDTTQPTIKHIIPSEPPSEETLEGSLSSSSSSASRWAEPDRVTSRDLPFSALEVRTGAMFKPLDPDRKTLSNEAGFAAVVE
eukprot:CAMPEP_0198142424 /NCGR_PEP_ID=MMETSP1443-20131203/5213_1 /TAXON_ID=186043 /ORGANISM="Entomoneis sp., Strain CCMP2396" /LENGTH=207 /DNA_ID=CAMNT_0043805421 /DNA_START=107 /DNA_END=727 /DNA_ORIENTATION=+